MKLEIARTKALEEEEEELLLLLKKRVWQRRAEKVKVVIHGLPQPAFDIKWSRQMYGIMAVAFGGSNLLGAGKYLESKEWT